MIEMLITTTLSSAWPWSSQCCWCGHEAFPASAPACRFGTGAARVSTFPREVAEAALTHVAGDRTERAYRRGDALEKRRALMEAWAAYCDPKAASVVSIARRGLNRTH
jgi:hypothetical protein